MSSRNPLIEKRNLLTFVLITSLFALWGFANDITNPLVSAFQTIMEISAAKASLIQFAFYGGYATMALPAALFVKRYSYKKGILLGLALYAAGAFLFIPAATYQQFGFFLLSLYILTFGLAFLETTANPYIYSLGDPETATRRLNLAQAFNPVGSLLGMFVSSSVILSMLESDAPALRNGGFRQLGESARALIRQHDLEVIRNPYVALGCVVMLLFVLISLLVKDDAPRNVPAQAGADAEPEPTYAESFRRLWAQPGYREGVLTQVFYVAAQIMCWTFIIQYAERLGLSKSTAQLYNICAMGLNLAGRFFCTLLMHYVNSRKLLTIFGLCAMSTMAGTILIDGMGGL
ncbi:MAG: L-fucose:H+ symporter permease, partial [Prevotellaceae bacterium]|nr:L-fucose:H+ symporter permease [Prevotellaceae bacterium]